MLGEGGGGDAGVHADHHVLDAPVFSVHTQPLGAARQLEKPCNVTGSES